MKVGDREGENKEGEGTCLLGGRKDCAMKFTM